MARFNDSLEQIYKRAVGFDLIGLAAFLYTVVRGQGSVVKD